ncbi:MAG: tetratricopeptide repeat protein [Promethearchaeota archaeon]
MENDNEHIFIKLEYFNKKKDELKLKKEDKKRILKGIEAFKQGNYKQVIEYFDKVFLIPLENDTDYELAISYWVARGKAYYYLRRAQDAINCLKNALKIDSNLKLVWQMLGAIFFHLGKYKKSMKCNKKALQIDSQFEEAWYGIGKIYQKLGNYRKAVENFEKVIEINPQYSDALGDIGHCYLKLGEYKKAIDYNMNALKLDPQNKAVLNNLGLVYSQLSAYNKAIRTYEKILQIDPKFKIASKNLNLLKNKISTSDKEQKAIMRNNQEEVVGICPVCRYKMFTNGELYRCKYCGNFFHSDCILKWAINEGHKLCPNCSGMLGYIG